ncbi:hypothetical protein GGI20_001353 [Coemansia sp. BCRC 34301]|nr:hypothetical protein GGI20_001353 [Coemansia sp. BCRC 34301]
MRWAAPKIWARRYSDIAAQVRQIVHPSEYTQIEHTKQVAQQARVQGADVGQRLSAEAKNQQQRAVAQLDRVFAQASSEEDYGAVLEGFHTLESAGRCVRVLQAMRSAGHRATAAQLSSVQALASRSASAEALADVSEEMRAYGVAPDDGCLVACLAARGCTELAYQAYTDARRAQRPIGDVAHAQLVTALADVGDCDLALGVARDATALPEAAYRALLRGAGRAMHYAAYAAAYAHLTAVVGAQLTESDYCAGLGVAARAADPALAASIVRRLRSAEYPVAEHHLEPLWEALVRARRWPAAFRALAAMRDAGFATTPASLRVLTRTLTVDVGDAESLADNVHAALVACHPTAPRVLDTQTLNAIVAGLALSGCVEAAADRLRRWFGPPPRDTDSYVAVLRGCVARKNLAVAEQSLARCIDEDRLAPTKPVYALMVDVALRQFNYEDAFVYLDAMKTSGFAPDWRTYSAIVRRCAVVRDPRATVALDEMRAAGHDVPQTLVDYVTTGGRSARHTPVEKTTLAQAEDGDGDGGDDASPFRI